MKIWPRLLGQAGPSPDTSWHEPEPDEQLESIGTPADADVSILIISYSFEPLFDLPKYPDPLRVLLQYIAEVSRLTEARCIRF